MNAYETADGDRGDVDGLKLGENTNNTASAPQQSKGDARTDSKPLLPADLAQFAEETVETTIVWLNMSRRNVQTPLLLALCGCVSLLNDHIVSLKLSQNVLGPKGAVLLGRALVTNNTLQFLEIERCDLIGSPYRPEHDGLKALAKGFGSARSTLRFLNIADNHLQPEGCRILLGALAFHPTLTALDVSHNALSLFNDKEGYLSLSYIIQFANQLCWLTIDGNLLPPPARRALQASLARNATLTSLSARNCDVSIEELRPLTRISVLTDLEC